MEPRKPVSYTHLIVAGAIIGGSTSSHNAVTTITGNTSVLVTNIQHSNSATVNLGDFGTVSYTHLMNNPPCNSAARISLPWTA